MNIAQYLRKTEDILQLVFSAVRKNTVAFILFLIVINLIIKSYNLYENSMHTDEIYRIYWGQRTYTDIFKMSKKELNPPVYLWVLHTWVKINGNYTNEVHARYLSLIFSVLTTIVIFLFGKSYFNYATGVAASLIFSFNPVQVVYAHNISAYTMITFLFISSLYVTHLFFVFFEHKNKKIRWILFALLIVIDTVLIYTHYMIVWGLLAQLIMAFFEYFKQKRAFFYYFATQVISVLLFLPWIPYMLANAKADSWMEKATWKNIQNLYIHFLGSEWVAILFIILATAMFLYNVWKKRIQTPKILIPLLVAILPVLGLSLISALFQPFWVERYMLYLIPGMVLLVAYQASLLDLRVIKTAIIGIFLVFCMKSLNVNPIVDAQLRQLMPVIAEEAREPGTLLVINADYMKYVYAHYFNDYLKYIKDTTDLIKDPKKMPGVFISTPSEIEKVYNMSQWHKIVYVQLHSEILDPHHKVSAWLKTNFKLEKKIVAKGVGLTLYRSPNTLWASPSQKTFFVSFENSREFRNITAKKVKSGNFSAYCNHKTLKYSEGIQGKIGQLYGKKGKLKVSAWIYLENSTKGNFAVSFADPTGKQYFWQNAQLDYSKYEQWQYVTMEISIPETKSPHDEMKCYFDAFSGGTAYIDDIEIQPFFEF
jgi:hypothetical protein